MIVPTLKSINPNLKLLTDLFEIDCSYNIKLLIPNSKFFIHNYKLLSHIAIDYWSIWNWLLLIWNCLFPIWNCLLPIINWCSHFENYKSQFEILIALKLVIPSLKLFIPNWNCSSQFQIGCIQLEIDCSTMKLLTDQFEIDYS